MLKHFIQQGINIEAFNEILPSLNDILSGSLREPMQNRGHSCKLKINRKCMQAILLTTINTDTILYEQDITSCRRGISYPGSKENIPAYHHIASPDHIGFYAMMIYFSVNAGEDIK